MKPLTNVPDILQKIVDVKKDEVDAIKRADGWARFRDQVQGAPAVRPPLAALEAARKASGHVALIAEIKKASPSKGIIREDFNPLWIAERYLEGGAAMYSILTDEHFFQGHLDYLRGVRSRFPLPALRKDFMIDRIQLYEARAAGADCILLIAACLDPHHLQDLAAEAREGLGLGVLVEFHDEQEWEAVLAAGPAPKLAGVNNRDLRTFDVSLEVTESLAEGILAQGSFLVAESGIFTPEDVHRLKDAGAGAVLVGESLMRQEDPGDAAKRLLEA